MVNRTSLILDMQSKKFYIAIVWPMACNLWALYTLRPILLHQNNPKQDAV